MSVRLSGIMASTRPLITLVMDDELLRQIDDFRFARRFPSRAAAMKYLFRRALEIEAREAVQQDARPS